jgi:hypothetical protein
MRHRKIQSSEINGWACDSEWLIKFRVLLVYRYMESSIWTRKQVKACGPTFIFFGPNYEEFAQVCVSLFIHWKLCSSHKSMNHSGFFFFLKSESSGFQTHFICVTSKEKYFCFNTSYTSFACLGWIKWLTLINWCQRISWTSESNAYSHKWVIVHQFSNKRNKANIVNTFSSNELTHMSHE